MTPSSRRSSTGLDHFVFRSSAVDSSTGLQLPIEFQPTSRLHDRGSRDHQARSFVAFAAKSRNRIRCNRPWRLPSCAISLERDQCALQRQIERASAVENGDILGCNRGQRQPWLRSRETLPGSVPWHRRAPGSRPTPIPGSFFPRDPVPVRAESHAAMPISSP